MGKSFRVILRDVDGIDYMERVNANGLEAVEVLGCISILEAQLDQFKQTVLDTLRELYTYCPMLK